MPYKHQGRSREGVDCLGLLVCSARECGVQVVDNLNYRRAPDPEIMRAGLLNHMTTVKREDLQVGDVLFIRWPRDAYPVHLAVISRGEDKKTFQIVHAPCDIPKKVCELSMPINWWPNVSMCLRWKPWAA